MKDNRFIELVNLYIDRQITAAETAELEAEMQGNPRRRAIYRQYCQLHSATKQVYDNFRANAANPSAGQPAGRVIPSDFKRRPRSNWIHYAGGLAAAACLAVVFVRYNSTAAQSRDIQAKVDAASAVQVAAVVPPAPAAVAPVAANTAPGPVRLRGNSPVEPDYAAMLAALRREEQRTFASGEIQSGRLPSLFDDGVFDARQFSPAKGQRTFRGKQTPEQQAEFTAFQFQR